MNPSLTPLSRGRANGTLAVLTVALFAYSALETMLAPALPLLQDRLGASLPAITWVLTGVLLSGAICTPVIGRLAETRDKRPILVGVLATVSIGVALSAMATDVTTLAVGQALQGTGLGLVPLALGIIRDTQPEDRVTAGNGLVIGAAAASTVAGLLLAGPIVDHLSWQWLYWLPFGVLVACLAAAAAIVPSCPSAERGRLDWPGAVLLAGALASILVPITRARAWGWSSFQVTGLILLGLALLVAFTLAELRTPHPLLEIRLLSRRTVLVTCTVAFVVGFGTFAVYVLVPMFVQFPTALGYGLGASTTEAGLYLLPLAVVATVAAPLTQRLEAAVGGKVVMLAAGAAMVVSALLLMACEGRSWLIYLSTAFIGLTLGTGLTQAMAYVGGTVPAERVASVTGLAFVVKAVGGTLGGQIGASVVVHHVENGAPTWDGFQTAFLIAAGVSILAVVVSAGLPRRVRQPAPARAAAPSPS